MLKLKAFARRFGPKLGIIAFYLFSFVVFLSWTFPFDKLKHRAIAQFQARQRPGSPPQELAIDELSSSWLTGVKATGIRLVTPAAEAGKPPTTLTIDSATARISLLGLLVGNKNVSFGVDAFSGKINGSYDESTKSRDVELELDAIDTSRIDPIAANIGFPIEGLLNGSIKLALAEGKASKGAGSVSLEIKDMVAGNAKELSVKTPMGPFTLPRLKVGTLSIVGEAKDGVLRFSKISAQGGDVDVTGDGKIQLRENTSDSLLDINIKFKINDAYRSKNDKTKLLFGAPGSKEKPMLELDPRMSRAKTTDGFFVIRVGGTLGRPDPQPGNGAFK